MDLTLMYVNKGSLPTSMLCIRSPFFRAAGVEIEENGAGCAESNRPNHRPGGGKGCQRQQRPDNRANAKPERTGQRRGGARHMRKFIQNNGHRV